MSKAVLISIQPKWCELIAKGIKTVEVRKTKPKLSTPFKVYIYCTNDFSNHATKSRRNKFWVGEPINDMSKGRYLGNGKVIGEFVCNKIDRITHCGTCNNDIRLNIVDINLYLKELDYEYLNKCKLSYYDLEKYSNGGSLYGWHISDLVIYDEPKELSEFHNFCETYPCCDESCEYYSWTVEGGTECMCDTEKPFKRPPQSWRYVEELKL